MKPPADKRRRGERHLSAEESALWRKVKRSVEPLPGFGAAPGGPPPELDDWLDAQPRRTADRSRSSPANAVPPAPPQTPSRMRHKTPTIGAIDDKTARKLSKGRLAIDARIDLHGMTQAAAHRALEQFILEARHAGYRMVLVITGKGRSGDGVLRQQVPLWLRAAPLLAHVSGFREAHITHGGAGALYVRLRKPTPSAGAGRKAERR